MTTPGQPVLLDWRDGLHYRRPAPWVLCGNPTPLRSHAGEASHKVCAENWNLAHPGESRFVSDTKPRRARTTTTTLDRQMPGVAVPSPAPYTGRPPRHRPPFHTRDRHSAHFKRVPRGTL